MRNERVIDPFDLAMWLAFPFAANNIGRALYLKCDSEEPPDRHHVVKGLTHSRGQPSGRASLGSMSSYGRTTHQVPASFLIRLSYLHINIIRVNRFPFCCYPEYLLGSSTKFFNLHDFGSSLRLVPGSMSSERIGCENSRSVSSIESLSLSVSSIVT